MQSNFIAEKGLGVRKGSFGGRGGSAVLSAEPGTSLGEGAVCPVYREAASVRDVSRDVDVSE